MQFGDIDVFIILDAAERNRFVPGFGEHLETARLHPVPDQPGHFAMAGIAVVQAFGGDLVEFELQAVDMPNARRAGRHVLVVIRFEFEEVKVVAAPGNGSRLFERALADGKHREARRQRPGLLHAGQQHVNAQRIRVDFHAGHGADRVHNKHDVRIAAHDRRDLGERVHQAGGSLVVNKRQRIELAGFELGIDQLR